MTVLKEISWMSLCSQRTHRGKRHWQKDSHGQHIQEHCDRAPSPRGCQGASVARHERALCAWTATDAVKTQKNKFAMTRAHDESTHVLRCRPRALWRDTEREGDRERGRHRERHTQSHRRHNPNTICVLRSWHSRVRAHEPPGIAQKALRRNPEANDAELGHTGRDTSSKGVQLRADSPVRAMTHLSAEAHRSLSQRE